MLLTKHVRLTSPILASTPPGKPDERRQFKRVKNPDGKAIRIVTDLKRWQWALLEARDALELSDVSTAAIIPALFYEVKNTSTYNRSFSTGGKRSVDKFESVSSGTVLAWRFTLTSTLPPHAEDQGRFTRAPDEEELDRMLAHIGEHMGMSEWGQDYLYGRFVLHPYRDVASTP